MSSLAPQPRFRIVDADGIALEGGKVYTYAAGTSTPKDSYTDSTLGSANTNPVILDTRGEADIWLSGAYKIIVTDSLDVLLPDHTIDNVRDLTLDATFTNPTLPEPRLSQHQQSLGQETRPTAETTLGAEPRTSTAT